MRVLILHLSDIHLKHDASSNPVLSRCPQIVSSIAGLITNPDYCFVVVTGDIAFSGHVFDYGLADQMLGELKQSLHSRLPNTTVQFILVPGNHDCDLSRPNPIRDALLPTGNNPPLDEIVQECAKVQANYEAFANRWMLPDTTSASGYCAHRVVEQDTEAGVIEFRLVNSAWMSTKEEKTGNPSVSGRTSEASRVRNSACAGCYHIAPSLFLV